MIVFVLFSITVYGVSICKLSCSHQLSCSYESHIATCSSVRQKRDFASDNFHFTLWFECSSANKSHQFFRALSTPVRWSNYMKINWRGPTFSVTTCLCTSSPWASFYPFSSLYYETRWIESWQNSRPPDPGNIIRQLTLNNLSIGYSLWFPSSL